eukprot:SAG31_NODE_4572_length_3127_cov_1.044914_1_plen_135_part_10
MSAKEIRSLCKQVELSASANREAAVAAAANAAQNLLVVRDPVDQPPMKPQLPFALTLTSFSWESALGRLLAEHGTAPGRGLGKVLGFESRPPWQAYPAPRRIIYLSPDAPVALSPTLQEDTVYCIGGLVDRSVIK